MAEEAGVVRELLDPPGEDRDRLAISAEIRRPAAEPDDGLPVVRRGLESPSGLLELPFAVASGFRVQRGRKERLAEKRPGFRARRELARGLLRRRLPPRRTGGEERKGGEEECPADYASL
jgi:hypothetical protein